MSKIDYNFTDFDDINKRLSSVTRKKKQYL